MTRGSKLQFDWLILKPAGPLVNSKVLKLVTRECKREQKSMVFEIDSKDVAKSSFFLHSGTWGLFGTKSELFSGNVPPYGLFDFSSGSSP